MPGNPMESVARVATTWCKSRGTQGDEPYFDNSWEVGNAHECPQMHGNVEGHKEMLKNILKAPSLP